MTTQEINKVDYGCDDTAGGIYGMLTRTGRSEHLSASEREYLRSVLPGDIKIGKKVTKKLIAAVQAVRS